MVTTSTKNLSLKESVCVKSAGNCGGSGAERIQFQMTLHEEEDDNVIMSATTKSAAAIENDRDENTGM